MPNTNAAFERDVQRITREFSLTPAEERRRDAILRIAYARIVDAFPCRPQPRSCWDRNADGTEARWNRVLSPIRMAIAAAVVMGDQQRIDRTLEASDAFFEECKADIRSLIPKREEESVAALALAETHAEGSANEAEIQLVRDPSPIAAERAIPALARHADRLNALVGSLRRYARQPVNASAHRYGRVR